MPNVILNYVIVIFLVLCVIGLISIIDTYLKRKNEIYQYQVDVVTNAGQPVSDMLEQFINECFVEYQVLILIPMNELYINADREKEICTDLGAKVAKEMSPHLLNVISQRYNTDMIGDILAQKIYLVVTDYVVRHNRTIDTGPQK